MLHTPPPDPQRPQVQVGALGSDALRYSGAIDCAAKVVRAEGLAGLFRGTTATVFRETPAFGLYFACYEGTKDWLERRWCWGQQASSFGAGGIAGTLSWVSIYPFDVVKSVQQVCVSLSLPVCVYFVGTARFTGCDNNKRNHYRRVCR